MGWFEYEVILGVSGEGVVCLSPLFFVNIYYTSTSNNNSQSILVMESENYFVSWSLLAAICGFCGAPEVYQNSLSTQYTNTSIGIFHFFMIETCVFKKMIYVHNCFLQILTIAQVIIEVVARNKHTNHHGQALPSSL